MSFNLDSYLGVQPDALEVYSQRADVLAANLANADTPGYLAKDIDFRSALAAAGQSDGKGGGQGAPASAGGALQPETTSPDDLTAGSPQSGVSTQQYLKYRVPLAPSLDGNSVDSQMEESAFAENNVRYEAALTFIEGDFSNLNTVISD
ncbi:MAG TPA: flagellar basal body rod protein FlgB [Steroidobacteraceae bacterium]|jgi:flagellar basal-body rod protein FlgB|nr:flagellar basal body rod protein FlgB [Steroidobacteraceae bacterium]